MITLYVNDGKVFVWNVKDWLKLREEYRIVGELVGSLACLPRQESLPGLPLALLPEEVTILIEQSVIQVVQNISLVREPSDNLTKEYKEYRKKLHSDEMNKYVAERKIQVMGMIDQIIEGKRRKLSKLRNSKKIDLAENIKEKHNIDDAFDKDIIIQEELAKISSLDENNTVVKIFTEDNWHMGVNDKPYVWVYPQSISEVIRYQVFKSMWEKGYFLTSGHKFGVDFLIYPGDPIKFHAHFLVVCLESNNALPIHKLIALGRLGTSVRKTIILASISKDDNVVIYQSLTWNGATHIS